MRTPPLLLNQIRMPSRLSEYSDPGKAAQQSAAVQAFSLQSPLTIHEFTFSAGRI
jgi:hypothetical protein